MKLKYIKELDGVRGIAAIMIIIFHFFQVLSISKSDIVLANLQKLSRFGQTGVTLFFVLSGFLISRILLATKGHENYFSSFYIRRSLRIFPLYYFFLLLSLVIVPILLKQPFIPFNKQWYFWVYLQNFAITFNWSHSGPSHLWSLAVEEHFYLFWPFIIYFFNHKQIRVCVYAIIILALAIRVILTVNNYGSFFFTFTNIDALAIGSLLALNELNGLKRRNYGLIFIIMVIPTIALWLLVGGNGNIFIQIIKLPLNAITYYGFLGVIIGPGSLSFLGKILTSKPLNYTGKISYGLYVYHPLVFYFYDKYVDLHSLFLNLIVSILFAYIVATISYYLFESRILSFKKYFQYSSNAKSEKTILT